MKSFKERFETKLDESPVGKVGRTGLKDADDHVDDVLVKKFTKIVKELGGKTVARLLISKMNTVKDVVDVDTSNHEDDIFESYGKDAETVLIKNNIKIKQKFSTKFGTEFVLAKKYDESGLKDILKDFKVTFDDKSIFVQN